VHKLRTVGSTWMAADDINYILRIQHMSTHSGVPYVEDFYFQVCLWIQARSLACVTQRVWCEHRAWVLLKHRAWIAGIRHGIQQARLKHTVWWRGASFVQDLQAVLWVHTPMEGGGIASTSAVFGATTPTKKRWIGRLFSHLQWWHMVTLSMHTITTITPTECHTCSLAGLLQQVLWRAQRRHLCATAAARARE
jgi:hypothetical protein